MVSAGGVLTAECEEVPIQGVRKVTVRSVEVPESRQMVAYSNSIILGGGCSPSGKLERSSFETTVGSKENASQAVEDWLLSAFRSELFIQR